MLKRVSYLLVGLLLLAGVFGTLWYRADAAAKGSSPAAANVGYQVQAKSDDDWSKLHQEMSQQCHNVAGEKVTQQMLKNCPYYNGQNPKEGNQTRQYMGGMMQDPAMLELHRQHHGEVSTAKI